MLSMFNKVAFLIKIYKQFPRNCFQNVKYMVYNQVLMYFMIGFVGDDFDIIMSLLIWH